MFGRDPRLPVDLVFGLGQTTDGMPLSKYVENLKSRLRASYELATAAADKARAQQKRGYDKRTRGADVEVGDRVLVKIVAFDGKHKIADKWEEEVYEVLEKPNGDIPVYVVQREDRTGRKRTLHRNLLLPVGARLEKEPAEDSIPEQREGRPRRRHTRHRQRLPRQDSDSEDSDQESSSEDLAVQRTVEVETEVSEEEELESDRGGDAHSPVRGEPENLQEHGDHDQTARGTPTPEEEPEENQVHAGDAEAEGQEESDEDGAERPQQPPQPAPRRSVRDRKPPPWMLSGDYESQAMSQQVSQADWLKRVEYFMSQLDPGSRQDVARAWLRDHF